MTLFIAGEGIDVDEVLLLEIFTSLVSLDLLPCLSSKLSCRVTSLMVTSFLTALFSKFDSVFMSVPFESTPALLASENSFLISVLMFCNEMPLLVSVVCLALSFASVFGTNKAGFTFVVNLDFVSSDSSVRLDFVEVLMWLLLRLLSELRRLSSCFTK